MPCAWPVQSLELSRKMSSITNADDLKLMVQFASPFGISYQPFLLLKTDKTRMTQDARQMTTLASNTLLLSELLPPFVQAKLSC